MEARMVCSRRQLLKAATLLAVPLSSGLLAGCGSGSTSPGAKPTTASSTAAAKQPSSGTHSLTWMVSDYTVGTEKWFKSTFVPEFEKRHPGTKLEILYVPWGSLPQKRDTMFAAGDAPDLLQSGAVMVVDYALKKMVIPIDDRLAQWKQQHDYYASSIEAATYNGKIYGLPSRIDARAMIYRTDLFKAKGLSLPTTWDELKSAALALTVKKGSEYTRLGYSLTFTNQQFFPVLWQNGGDVLSKDGRSPAFDSPEGIDALSYWVDVLDSIAPQGTQLSAAGPQIPLIAAGRIAAEMNGDGEMFNVVTFAPSIVSDIKVLPPLKRKTQVINVFNNWFGITTQSKDPDLSWALLTAFNEPKTLLAYDQTNSSLPPRKSLAKSSFVTDPKYQLTEFLDIVQHYAKPQPKVPSYAECWKSMDDGLQAALRHQSSPQEALKQVAAKWRQLLQEAYGAVKS